MKRDEINRRRFLRVKFPFTIHIDLPATPAISTYTEDISEGGVKIFIKEELDELSIVDLEIYLKSKPIICKGKIVWVEEKTSDFIEGEVFFYTGIEFREIKEKDKLIIKEKIAELEKERKSKEGKE